MPLGLQSPGLLILWDERELWCDTTEGSKRVKLRSALYEVRSWRRWCCFPGVCWCNKANPMHSQPFEPLGLCRVTGSYLVFPLNDEAKIPNQIFGTGDTAWWLSACLAFMRPQVQSSASTTGGKSVWNQIFDISPPNLRDSLAIFITIALEHSPVCLVILQSEFQGPSQNCKH